MWDLERSIGRNGSRNAEILIIIWSTTDRINADSGEVVGEGEERVVQLIAICNLTA